MSPWSPQYLDPLVPGDLTCDELAVAITAAQRAGRVIVDYFHQGVEMRSKGTSDLVSNADLEAEQVIAETIRTTFPSHAIMAEETIQESADSEHLWIFDPLDGTNNFAHRIPHFAVSIGYVRSGVAQGGVIVNPMTGDWHVTWKGKGAWHDGQRCFVNKQNRLDQTMIAVGFYYDRGLMMEATLRAIGDFFRRNIHGVRRMGTASLDLAMLGRGLFGLYFEYQLSPWDHAAGALFVEEAGGKLSDCQGGSLPFDRKSSLLATNGMLHDASLLIVQNQWQTYQRQLAEANQG